MCRAVIFDLYGTLLYSPGDSRSFLKLAKRTADVRSALEIAMTTDNPTLAHFASRLGLDRPDDLPSLDAALAAEIAAIQKFVDVEPTLLELKARGIQTAVISNLASPYKQPYFGHQLDALIDIAVFSCDCGVVKPDARIYENALKQLGVSPGETIMVGDSFRSDVDGPSKLGIVALHLIRSGGTSGATRVISSLDALLQNAK